MMLRRRCAVACLVVMLAAGGVRAVGAQPGALRTIRVPGDYPTIRQALAAARSGDTVQVAAGTYHERELGIPASVRLAGAGWASTTIEADGQGVVLRSEAGSVVEDLALHGSGPGWFDGGVWAGGGTTTLRRCRIWGNSAGVWAWCFDASTCAMRIVLESCIIDHNRGPAVAGNEYPIWELRHDTLADNGGDGAYLNQAASMAEDSLFVGNAGIGLANLHGASVRRNLFWNNGTNWTGSPGQDSLVLDPLFRDAAHSDYRPRAGSAAVGRGAGGSDLGALSFVPVGSAPTNLRATYGGDGRWTLSWTRSGARGSAIYLGMQPGTYERRIEAGAASSWTPGALPGDLTYYACASAYDADGSESRVGSEVSFAVPPAGAGKFEEDSAVVVLNGAWTRVSAAQASAGAYAVSTTAGDSAIFTFSGDSVTLYRCLGPDGGRADVSVDGQSYGAWEFYLFEPRWQAPAVLDGLGAGVHRLNLRVRSDAAERSRGRRVSVDAFAAPAPFQPSADQVAALERANWYRDAAGMPPLRAPLALNLAAQAHADYSVLNRNEDGHGEVEGKPGFVGQWPSERAAYFGYSGGVGEDMHFIADPIGAIDGFMATVYHRNLIMGYGFTHMGYGMGKSGGHNADVLDMSAYWGRGYTVPTRTILTYPASGQRDVPHDWGGGESPDPLPGKPKPVGYPVSLYIVQASTEGAGQPSQASLSSLRFPELAPQLQRSAVWQVRLAELRNAQGQLVPCYLIEQNTDAPRLLGPDVVFLIAERPLAFSATYTAYMAGTDSGGAPFDHTWSFTTCAAAQLTGVKVEPGAQGAQAWWWTAGPAASALQYGLTTAYGLEARGETELGTYHQATLGGLMPSTTYHYRIVTWDEQGALLTSPDRSFATRAARTLLVPAQYATVAAALRAAQAGDVVQVAAGIYHERELAVPQGVTLRGESLWSTILDADGQGVVLRSDADSVAENLTLRGSGTGWFDAGVWAGGGTTTLRRCQLSGCSAGVWAWCFEPATCAMRIVLEDCIITHNRGPALACNEYPVWELRHNTLAYNGGDGIYLNQAASVAEDNIFVGNGGVALVNQHGARVSHNLFWGNREAWRGSAGAGSLSADPLFRDAERWDYRLRAGSPAVGAGTAGTDLGALPFAPVGQPPAGVQVHALGEAVWQVTWTPNGAASYTVWVWPLAQPVRQFDVGASGGCLLSDLPSSGSYELAVCARDAQGNESRLSPRVAFGAIPHKTWLPAVAQRYSQ